MAWLSATSTSPKKIDVVTTKIAVITERRTAWRRVGQRTLRSSSRDSRKYVMMEFIVLEKKASRASGDSIAVQKAQARLI